MSRLLTPRNNHCEASLPLEACLLDGACQLLHPCQSPSIANQSQGNQCLQGKISSHLKTSTDREACTFEFQHLHRKAGRQPSHKKRLRAAAKTYGPLKSPMIWRSVKAARLASDRWVSLCMRVSPAAAKAPSLRQPLTLGSP